MSSYTARGAGIRDTVRAAVMAALLIGPISGCAEPIEHPKTTPVNGKVTYKGQPVTKGTITFQPNKGQASVGDIQPDGTYRLSTFGQGDGAVPGHYRIFVIANTAESNKMPGSSPGWKPPQDLVPKKYNKVETSGLEATVTEDKAEYNFELP